MERWEARVTAVGVGGVEPDFGGLLGARRGFRGRCGRFGRWASFREWVEPRVLRRCPQEDSLWNTAATVGSA